MSKADLGAALRAGELVVAPGIHDMISAVVANKVGFDFVYASGFWLTASAYGLPDAGIATYTQMLDRVSTLARTAAAGVIADADTGYGGLLNVRHTVKGYERAGAAAIQLEDQEFPKKCGHTPFKRVIPVEDMAEKVKVACAARRDPEIELHATSVATPVHDASRPGASGCQGGLDSRIEFRCVLSAPDQLSGRTAHHVGEFVAMKTSEGGVHINDEPVSIGEDDRFAGLLECRCQSVALGFGDFAAVDVPNDGLRSTIRQHPGADLDPHVRSVLSGDETLGENRLTGPQQVQPGLGAWPLRARDEVRLVATH